MYYSYCNIIYNTTCVIQKTNDNTRVSWKVSLSPPIPINRNVIGQTIHRFNQEPSIRHLKDTTKVLKEAQDMNDVLGHPVLLARPF